MTKSNTPKPRILDEQQLDDAVGGIIAVAPPPSTMVATTTGAIKPGKAAVGACCG